MCVIIPENLYQTVYNELFFESINLILSAESSERFYLVSSIFLKVTKTDILALVTALGDEEDGRYGQLTLTDLPRLIPLRLFLPL